MAATASDTLETTPTQSTLSEVDDVMKWTLSPSYVTPLSSPVVVGTAPVPSLDPCLIACTGLILASYDDDDELMLNVLRCHLTY